MEVSVARTGIVTYVTPDGPLTEAAIADVERGLREAEGDGPASVVFDMRLVPLIDGRGLEFLLDLSVKLAEEGGSLCLSNVNATLGDILRITRLDKQIPVCDDFMERERGAPL